jgi:small subunit ribosomal protein S9
MMEQPQDPDQSTGMSSESADAAASTSPTAVLDIGSATSSTAAGQRTASLVRGRVDRFGVAMGTGRRKTAVARVRISEGNGKFTVNGRDFPDYFPLERDQQMILAPLRATGTLGKVDIWVRVQGGGPTGQTGAVVLGIARALQVKNSDLHEKLSEGGYLTRDGRMVERKKYGRRKARRSFQFSKR